MIQNIKHKMKPYKSKNGCQHLNWCQWCWDRLHQEWSQYTSSSAL